MSFSIDKETLAKIPVKYEVRTFA